MRSALFRQLRGIAFNRERLTWPPPPHGTVTVVSPPFTLRAGLHHKARQEGDSWQERICPYKTK